MQNSKGRNRKKKKTKKLNMKKVEVCFGFVFSIIFIIILVNILLSSKSKDLKVFLDNEELSLKNEVIFENDIIYFSKDDINDIFDKTLYYNDVEKELITTHDTNIAVLKLKDNKIEINDESKIIKGQLMKQNKEVYLPISELTEVYDLELNYYEKTNKIIMDSLLESKKEAVIVKRTSLKNKKGFFKATIEKLIIGEKVVLIEENGKYSLVRSSDGNIGYVKTNTLSDITNIRIKKEEKLPDLHVFRKYSNVSGVYDNVSLVENKLNVVNPTFFTLEKEGKVTDISMNSTATYSIYENWTNENGLTILPTFSNNENVSNALLKYQDRKKAAVALTSYLTKYGYMGINIEFNQVDDLNSFYRFIIEVTPRLKKANLKVIVTLNDNIEKKRIKDIVDYVLEK